jgi:hypothetical protein
MRRLLTSLFAFFGLTLAANAQCATGYTQLSNVFACQLNSTAITAANLTSGVDNNTTDSSIATASVSPGANKLDIVSVESRNSSATPNVPTVTGASGTWTQIATRLDATNSRRVTLFRDLSASPGSGALTISFASQVQDQGIAWSVDEFSRTDTTGTHGSGAIVQSVGGTTSGTNTGFTVTLSALGSANNAAMGFVRNNMGGTISPGSGFTQLSQTSLTNGTQNEAEWAINKTAVNWTWGSQTVISVGIAIEIKSQ